jgi:hypothetical protein
MPAASVAESSASLRSAVLVARPANPALQRLQQRVLAESEASEVITSYDRMHHRHSRS